MVPYIQTGNGLNLILNGKMRTISAEEECYPEVLEAVKNEATEAQVLEILERDLKRVTAAVQELAENDITDDVTIRGGQVLYRGEEVHNTLTAKMLQMLDEGFNLVPMARFLENLMQNPSHRAVQDLYTFLEYGKMPITADGCFLAYKAVRADYMDIYSGTFDNSVGRTVEIPRNKVDEDPDRTCSKGLHVCSFEYLPHFSHANGHVMICKVNPRDVVAIPRDYNNTKMRVCRYEVVGEHEGYYQEFGHILGYTVVATEEEPFLVEIEGHEPETRRFARLVDAAAAFEDATKEGYSVASVVLKNGLTGVVIDSYENPDYEDDFEDEEDEEEIGFTVLYGDSQDEIREGVYDVFAEGIEDYSDARETALDAKDQNPGKVVQIRDEETGEVRLTLV